MGSNLKDGGVLIGAVTAATTATGRFSGYRLEITHKGLNEYRLLRAPDTLTLQNKAQTQIDAWAEKWSRAYAKSSAAEFKFQSKGEADRRTKEAVHAIAEANDLLLAALNKIRGVNWTTLENHAPFVFSDSGNFLNVVFDAKGQPTSARQAVVPPAPQSSDLRFQPRLSFWDKLFSARRQRLEEAAHQIFDQDLAKWERQRDETEGANARARFELQAAQSVYARAKEAFLAQQEDQNRKVSDLRSRYLAKDPAAVISNAELILSQSEYPDWVPKEFSAHYNVTNRILVVEFQLPPMEALPKLSRVDFISSRSETKEKFLNESEQSKLFDSVLYQIALRTLHELFNGDIADAIDAIVFNGWLTWINQATGKEESGCLLSLQASKREFAEIDLSRVQPKACFRQLKGVSAAKLSGLTPIIPVLQFDKDDPRFVATREVADKLDSGTNLAAIAWDDFEHLVRELFEKEFAFDGGDVKITRASADGGVDAVVFDPDPIRGGKIVVQAKRYTNTVGVSAVRDLYGTMMNEGAMKGILVTTSDYGPDSYHFAKDKPLTLLNGGNLLALLSKHGHKARIDLAEARLLREAELRS